MYGTTTVNNLEIIGNIYYQGKMLTYLGTASSSPIYVQDSGNISIGLGIITTILFLMVVGFMYNNMTRKKPWL